MVKSKLNFTSIFENLVKTCINSEAMVNEFHVLRTLPLQCKQPRFSKYLDVELSNTSTNSYDKFVGIVGKVEVRSLKE